MDFLWIHTLLLRVAFCYSFYNRDIHSNDTGLLLVGGAKTGISQSVEFWVPDRARSGKNHLGLANTSNENPYQAHTSSENPYQALSIHCPTVIRGMWGHTTNSLSYGQGGTKCKVYDLDLKIALPQSKLIVSALCIT